MTILEAIVLGAIQGITEFLPISSSGHLVLLQRILGISGPVLLFDTMLHVGTLAAVVVVLRRDIGALLRRIVQPLTGFLILGTIPTVAAALILKDRITAAFESGEYLGFAFLLTALALLAAEGLSRRSGIIRPGEAMSPLDALIVGICQAVAIIPGVSRSGLTLSGALSRKLNRDYAARFSFLLSIPAITGALALQLLDLRGQNGPAETVGIEALIAGTAAAAVVGFFAVQLMLQIVRKHSLWGFAVYTAVLGTMILADHYLVGMFF
ncbi:MAG: undecaprenyl-diphosphate phosphatase [Spirochaetaceae bacterium]|jgi:undecaprenyl-diphosphatase|nr:undecaprenyl-diphosphate phosphatase [Spirochaetaceae bacterium]